MYYFPNIVSRLIFLLRGGGDELVKAVGETRKNIERKLPAVFRELPHQL